MWGLPRQPPWPIIAASINDSWCVVKNNEKAFGGLNSKVFSVTSNEEAIRPPRLSETKNNFKTRQEASCGHNLHKFIVTNALKLESSFSAIFLFYLLISNPPGAQVGAQLALQCSGHFRGGAPSSALGNNSERSAPILWYYHVKICTSFYTSCWWLINWKSFAWASLWYELHLKKSHYVCYVKNSKYVRMLI